MIEGIYENKEESIKDSKLHFQEEIEVLDYICASLGALAIGTLSNVVKENEVLSKDFPATDYWLSCHITNVVNTALSIKELCISGFDTQARSLIRIFDERILQLLILFSSAEDYEKWKNPDSSKSAHYDLFSKKKSLLKKAKKLDEKYFKLTEQELITIKALREERDEYYSDCIHGAHTSVIVGSIAYPFKDDKDGLFISSIFGRASSCSYQTLHHLIGQLSYFSYMLNALLNDLHQIQNVNNNKFISEYKKTELSVMKLASEIVIRKSEN